MTMQVHFNNRPDRFVGVYKRILEFSIVAIVRRIPWSPVPSYRGSSTLNASYMFKTYYKIREIKLREGGVRINAA